MHSQRRRMPIVKISNRRLMRRQPRSAQRTTKTSDAAFAVHVRCAGRAARSVLQNLPPSSPRRTRHANRANRASRIAVSSMAHADNRASTVSMVSVRSKVSRGNTTAITPGATNQGSQAPVRRNMRGRWATRMQRSVSSPRIRLINSRLRTMQRNGIVITSRCGAI
jgi:hypothetical protein